MSFLAFRPSSLPALIAAGALMIDYILTVAVSVAAGIAALTSAVPVLFPHREALGLIAIFFIIVMNLRGVRESGKFFAVPTYFAIGALGLMVVLGTIQSLVGPGAVPAAPPTTPALPLAPSWRSCRRCVPNRAWRNRHA